MQRSFGEKIRKHISSQEITIGGMSN
jgi:hypothetical protein